ncbi:hypothetical protein SAMN06265367_10954 [Algoriphagus winogradskyi]|uniref:Uncharacterized protein n=1 Tax=Algoriphagus winogradskyi TaxID=237017 RepID=A0ABY1PH66_9BACT|nr:hypothetical protein SAMN06265367_10954 [Algoriphagus winogradskyi]
MTRGMFGDDTVLLIAPFQGLELNDNKYQFRWATPIAEVLSPFRAKTSEAIFNYSTSQIVLPPTNSYFVRTAFFKTKYE